MRLPAEVWQHVFTFDPTFHEVFRSNVLPELRRAHTAVMADIFLHFFWDERCIRSVTYDEKAFHLTTTCHQQFTIQYLTDNDDMITYRVHNRRTGLWYDRVL